MASDYKRVNVLLRPDQYSKVHDSGLSLSGLVRDLIDDRFSESKIVLSVERDTKRFYDTIVSNFGSDDMELEKFLLGALDEFLAQKADQIDKLRTKLSDSRSKATDDA